MSVRPIVLLGDPRLRLKGKPVDSFGKYLHELLDDLAHTMRDAPGVGLAAPQLGEAMQACVIEVEGQLHELVNPRIVRSDGRRSRPRGLPLDPGLRRLRHPPRARLGRRPEPSRPEDQGRRVRAARAGAPARARPPRRQALHRLPRLDGRADGRRGPRTRTRTRSARRRAPWRDRRAGRRLARADCLPRQRRVRRCRACAGSRRHPDIDLVGVVTAPPRACRAGAVAPVTPVAGRRRGAGDPGHRSRPTGSAILRPSARCWRSSRTSSSSPTTARSSRRRCSRLRHGALNLHPSLLPRHRGATPIPAAILAGDAATGVTLIRMDDGLDTGPIVAQASAAARRATRRRRSSRRSSRRRRPRS